MGMGWGCSCCRGGNWRGWLSWWTSPSPGCQWSRASVHQTHLTTSKHAIQTAGIGLQRHSGWLWVCVGVYLLGCWQSPARWRREQEWSVQLRRLLVTAAGRRSLKAACWGDGPLSVKTRQLISEDQQSASLRSNRPGPARSPFSPFWTTGEGLRGEESSVLCERKEKDRTKMMTPEWTGLLEELENVCVTWWRLQIDFMYSLIWWLLSGWITTFFKD